MIWVYVCYPFKESDLGIKRAQTWNKAIILKHVWRLLFSYTDPSSMSGLLQCPLGHGRRLYSVKIGIKGSLSLVLVMRLLPFYV
jgi:hypothetical protein